MVSIQKRRRRKQEEPVHPRVPYVLLRSAAGECFPFLPALPLTASQQVQLQRPWDEPWSSVWPLTWGVPWTDPNQPPTFTIRQVRRSLTLLSKVLWRTSSLSGGLLHSQWAEWWP